MEAITRYYMLTKPGIIRGNVMTAGAGFLLAAKGHVDVWVLLAVLLGTSLVIASACVFNNYIDRELDKKMVRTKKRALVIGTVSAQQALVYATALGVFGFTILMLYTNASTVMLGVTAFFFYVVLYGLAKRRSPYGTLVGSVPGALPVTAGYTAAAGQLDGGALLVFLCMVVWQMPHFYAIATYRVKDYRAAGLPVLTVVRGIARARKSIVGYVAGYVLVASSLFVFGYTGYCYLIVMSVIGLFWFRLALTGFNTTDDAKWARKVFGFSLLVLMTFSIMISLEAWLP